MFTSEQIKAAQQADLYTYLLQHHAGDVKKEGRDLRIPGNGGLHVSQGYWGAGWYGTGERRLNSIDVLVQYFGYTFKEAVEALTEGTFFEGRQTAPVRPTEPPAKKQPAPFPEPVGTDYRRIYAYLIKERGLTRDLIHDLIHRGQLWQGEYGNAVFANPERTAGDVRGTYDKPGEKPYKRTIRLDPDAMFTYQPDPEIRPTKIYICEGVIDALSLYLLLDDKRALYAAMSGVQHTREVEHIALMGLPIFICTDRDEEGQGVRDRFCNRSQFGYLIPRLHDFNDDWKAVSKGDTLGYEKLLKRYQCA